MLQAIPSDSRSAENTSRFRPLRVEGDAMAPDFRPGEIVMVDTDHAVPSPPGVYAIFDGFGLVLKQLEPILGNGAQRIRVSSRNKEYDAHEVPFSGIRIAGRVVGKWQQT